MNYSSADKAFVFNGTDDYISGRLNNTGDLSFTVSIWFYETVSNENTLWMIGSGSSSANPNPSIALAINSTGSLDLFIFSGLECRLSTFRATYGTHKWHNVVCTRVGKTLKYFINGVQQNITLTGADEGLSLAANTVFNIGARTGNQLGQKPFQGFISNFKLYDTVLTAEEVKTLYDMGRCDEGHHVVNFSKTRVGIGFGDGEAPRAALDVRGDFYLNNNLVLGRYVGFSVYRSSATTGGDANPVVWNAVWAKSIEFNDLPNTTGFYRIPYTGKYLFTFYCIAGGTLNMQLFKNSSASTSGRTFTKHVPYDDKGTGEGTWFQLTGNGIEDFAAGEYVHVTTSGSFYGQSSNPHNGFSLTFLGA
jgi:hypothetical protein